MKRFPCTDFISPGLVVTALLAATLTHAFAAEGDLDVAFDPAISPPAPGLYRLYQEHVYFPEESPSRIVRLRDDGSLDPDWSLPTDVGWRDLICLPAGGFAVLGSFGLDLAWTEGSLSRVAPTDFRTAGVLRLFARRDGSVIQANTFTEGRGEEVVQDQEERLVAVGGFIRARNEERLGLVRFHRSGQIDPRWNPAPALGIALENATNLTAWPYGVALGPSNSVVVAVRLAPGESESRDLLATIDEQGEVTMSLLVTNALSHLQPVVQPDGRIIVVGGFTNWNGHAVTGIVRLQPDGTWDPTFEVTLGPEPLGSLFKPILDESGRLLISGEFSLVNGTPRPGLARIFAYTPPASPPTVTPSRSQVRVATNDVLWLDAEVGGFPPPKLQWYRNGEPLAGATNRALRWPVEVAADLGEFQLGASSTSGSNQTPPISVTLATRSTRPGELDPDFNRPLPEFPLVTHLVPLPDGRILVTSDSLDFSSGPQPVVGRLNADGTLDSTFGEGGLLRANKRATHVAPLPDGGLLVAGHFTEFDSVSVSGLVALDARGRRLPIAFPVLDRPELSRAIRQPDGKYLIAGTFRQVGGQPAIRLARLLEDGSLDPTFTSSVQPWQGIATVVLDRDGRLLLSGNSIDADSAIPKAEAIGLYRLLPNGTLDPSFQRYPLGVRTILLEPDGAVLIGSPPVRLADDGTLLTTFQRIDPSENDGPGLFSEHRSVRFPDGSVLFPLERDWTAPSEFIRWRPDGQRDFSFRFVPPRYGPGDRYGPQVRAAALLADGSVLFATGKPATVPASSWPDLPRLRRLLPDPDLRLTDVRVTAGELRATLATQPDINYEVRSRASLQGPPSASLQQSTGDGYLDEVATPAAGTEAFLELRRDDTPDN